MLESTFGSMYSIKPFDRPKHKFFQFCTECSLMLTIHLGCDLLLRCKRSHCKTYHHEMINAAGGAARMQHEGK